MAYEKNDIKFVKPPDGIHPFGLQVIKRVGVTVWRDRKPTDQKQEGYRMVFRHRTIENCFMNHEFAEAFSEKSNMIKTLSNMTGGQIIGESFDVVTKDRIEGTPRGEVIRIMDSLVTHWFNISCITKGKKGNSYVNERRIYLHPQDAQWGSCRDYFGATKAPIIPPIAEQPRPNLEPSIAKPSGFETMPDASLTQEYPYYYDISTTQYLEKAQILLDRAPGIKLDKSGFRWRTKTKVPQLEKYFEPDLAQDDLPF